MLKKIIVSLTVVITVASCSKENLMKPVNQNLVQNNASNAENKLVVINPYTYLASLQFDGKDNFDTGERNFPQSFLFNTAQDANSDGNIDVEDNLENLIQYSIGSGLVGTGRTGLPFRGPNNQKPTVYFHIAYSGSYKVYEYWLYYADNDWLNDHEHDWEKYFVYELSGVPKYIKISTHNSFTSYAWSSVPKDYGHPFLKVDGGSHAMKITAEDGVKIKYNGYIKKNNGTLLSDNLQTIPYTIYSNDSGVSGAVLYLQTPNTFYFGDPQYSTNSTEFGDARQAPWLRLEWGTPPNP